MPKIPTSGKSVDLPYAMDRNFGQAGNTDWPGGVMSGPMGGSTVDGQPRGQVTSTPTPVPMPANPTPKNIFGRIGE